MNPLLAIGIVLIVFNFWMKSKIERKQRQERNQPKWNEKVDREKYNEEIIKLKMKYTTEKRETDED